MALPQLNQYLLQMALDRTKEAFVPSPAAAAAGGPPPGDPAAGGGAPPPPPMDPSMGGGMPPGGAPPMGGGGPPPGDPTGGGAQSELDAKIQNSVHRAMQTAQGPGGAGGAKPPKTDINTVATDLFQLKKMFYADLRRRGIELPPDVLDGPNRDPVTGLPSFNQQAGSEGGAAGPGGGAPPQGAIKPIEGIQPGIVPGGDGKMAGYFEPFQLVKMASEVLSLYSVYLENKSAESGMWDIENWGKSAAAIEPVGEPYSGPAPASVVVGKAAALAKMFSVSRK